MIVGLDMGGTNIDGVIIIDGQISRITKKPIDKKNLFASIWNCLDELLAGYDTKKIKRINLSTTISTNAIVEGKTAPVGMMIQAGPGMVPANLFGGLGESIYLTGYTDHRGYVIEEFDSADVARGIKKFKAKGIEACAVVTKFSTRNPQDEKKLKGLLEEDFYPITMGHTMSGVLNFPRRAYTAYLNSAVHQTFRQFSDYIRKSLKDKGIDAPVYILKADGGTMDLSHAVKKPVETILSGPAASFMGMSAMLSTEEDAVLLDIGGTTTDIFFLADGIPLFEPLGIRIDQFNTLVRSIYSVSIGLGGDSCLAVEAGKIKIGPQRAGKPYAFGGPRATPSDAMIAKGLLSPADLAWQVQYAPDGEEGTSEIPQVAEIRRRAEAVMVELGRKMNVDALVMADMILARMAEIIKNTVEKLLKEINDRPVYTIKELLADRQIRPQHLCIIGGSADVLAPVLAEKFALPCHSPANSHVANAIGAALAKPTAEINMHVNTAQRILRVPELELYENVRADFDLEQARKKAKQLLADYAASMDFFVDEAEVDIVEESSFNMVRGFSGAGKNIRIKAQIKPGLIDDWEVV